MTQKLTQITVELAKADYEALSEQATEAQMSVAQLVASIAVSSIHKHSTYEHDADLLDMQHRIHSQVFRMQRHHAGHARKWLMAHQDELGDIPWVLMESEAGAQRVLNYLSAHDSP